MAEDNKRKAVQKSLALFDDTENGWFSELDPREWYKRGQTLTDELYRKYKFQFMEDSPLFGQDEVSQLRREQYYQMIRKARSLMGEVREYLKQWEEDFEPIFKAWLTHQPKEFQIKDLLPKAYADEIVFKSGSAQNMEKLLGATREISGRVIQIEGYHRKLMKFVRPNAYNLTELEEVLYQEKVQRENEERELLEMEAKWKKERGG